MSFSLQALEAWNAPFTRHSPLLPLQRRSCCISNGITIVDPAYQSSVIFVRISNNNGSHDILLVTAGGRRRG